ncbi:uncharacterized protein LACBIDRAFT_297884 [Laccaria bicolor S238N-H82]|uniref:Predicted protein n=1 Tax=Laccaria bicolor (strain S238N-H82 / ATCC MYA-4686) TaxID=486041 RepID=B0DB42_LACBS|nr:uncharacterized protein LACBIDRAFT_297884 [Laccaria bicolor S238N-H82]EDR08322.1 predicted protein [Laccaria bicolor S238N-H82]|eukprot:XP_001881392.1 predicted protein [Laccaria bicolor S238N-H82]
MEEARAKRGADLVKTVGDTLLSTPRIRVQLPEEKAEYFERVQRSDAFPMDPEGRHEKESEKLTLKLHSPQNSVYNVVIHTEEHTDAGVGNRYVFKLYGGDREVQDAFNEYERYIWLRKQKFQGCVKIFGLFHCVIAGSDIHGLLMSNEGRLLAAGKLSNKRRKSIGPKYQATVKELSRRTNITHGGLFLEHFIFNSKSEILSLVSWGFARAPSGDAEENVEEMDLKEDVDQAVELGEKEARGETKLGGGKQGFGRRPRAEIYRLKEVDT